MKSGQIKVFLTTLPLYFQTSLGFPIPFFTWILTVPRLWDKRIWSDSLAIFIPALIFLGFVQLIFLHNINYHFFISRGLASVIFVLSVLLLSSKYQGIFDKYCLYGLWITLVYGLYSAPSYMLGYEKFLIPGTGGPNNVSELGHLRCSTFGEGNYFGGYLGLMCLIYGTRVRMLLCILIGVLIAYSPAAALVWLFCFTKALCQKIRMTKTLNATCMGLLLFLALFTVYKILNKSVTQARENETTSLSERIEFFRSGLVIFSKSPLIGAGFGQYGQKLSDVTQYKHLIKETIINERRYIANNNVAELLSEFGILGIALYLYLLFRMISLRHPLLSGGEIALLFIVLGTTMPTLFQIVTGALLGILFGKYRTAIKDTMA